jgi:hypothetical protein
MSAPPDEYCFLFIQWWPLCMTKGEWSGWVQAVGAVVAIGVAFFVAQIQTRATRRESLRKTAEQRLETAKTLDLLAGATSSSINTASAFLATRQHIYTVATTDRMPSRMLALRQLSQQLATAPFYGMPAELMRCAAILSGTLDQFIWKVETALSSARDMDAAAYDDFQATVESIKVSLKQTTAEIQQLLSAAKQHLGALD